MNEYLLIILITFLPFLELRASIPYGIVATSIPWYWVSIICIVTNIILGPIIYVLLDKFIHLFLRIKAIDKIYSKIVERTQKRIHKELLRQI